MPEPRWPWVCWWVCCLAAAEQPRSRARRGLGARLLTLFGWDARVRRLRIAAGEGALAAGDRARLLRLAWDEEKRRLGWLIALALLLVGLTTVAVALLSMAVVVHYWDTPYRSTAAWSVALVWVALWVTAALMLLRSLRQASQAFEPARQELERDWEWIQERFGLGGEEEAAEAPKPARRPVSQEELLARIAVQRERIATLQAPAPPKASGPAGSPAALAASVPADESPTAAALRIAKAHPITAGAAAAAVVAVVGPRRLLRWAAVVFPVLWRMR